MKFYKIIYFLFILTVAKYTSAQIIDNTPSFKNSGNTYIRFQYDNDFFTKTDEYYTQGIHVELVDPSLKKNPLSNLLLSLKNSDKKYGLSIDHFGYTPTSIRSNEILFEDRPFCGNLSVKSFVIATDSKNQQRLSSAIVTGIMDPAAGGKEMQTTIHQWLNNTIPQGWQHQIKNDVIINYNINYEKKLLNHNNNFLLNGTGDIKLGTHDNKISAGMNFMAGNFNNPYQPMKEKIKKVTYYLYGQAKAGFTAYDATLQGGIVNKNSPYTIAAKDITRLTFQGDYGIVVQFNKLYLEYSQSILTKEFTSGKFHRWGGFSIGISL